jgi:hypothetical protein
MQGMAAAAIVFALAQTATAGNRPWRSITSCTLVRFYVAKYRELPASMARCMLTLAVADTFKNSGWKSASGACSITLMPTMGCGGS